MEKLKVIDAIHIAGSIASLTGLSLLAIGQVTDTLKLASIFSYAMSVSIFLGILSLVVFYSSNIFQFLQNKVGNNVAVSLSIIFIPLIIWGNFYLILLLKSLAKHEFTWLLEQIAK